MVSSRLSSLGLLGLLGLLLAVVSAPLLASLALLRRRRRPALLGRLLRLLGGLLRRLVVLRGAASQLVHDLLHAVDVLARRLARVVEAQPLLDLLAQLLAKLVGGLLREVVDAAGDRALVREVARDAALVLGGGAPDEGRVEDEAVLGRVALGLERAEERLLGAEDLHRRGRVLGEVGERAGVRDEARGDRA